MVQKRPTPLWLHFLAHSEAASHVDVTARVEGEIQSIDFTPGQRVKKGMRLYHIDETPYLQQLHRAQAKLDDVRASYRLAKSKVERYRPLVAEHLVAKQKYDELQAALAKYAAQIKAAKAAIAQAELQLSWCDITAPIDGIADRSKLLKGNLIKPGTVLTTVTDAKRLYLYFHPTSRDAALIRRYQSSEHPEVLATVRGDEGMLKPLKGKVEYMAPSADATTDTVTVRAVVNNPKSIVVPGSFFDVKMLLGTWDVKTISPRQLNYAPEGSFVYIVDRNQTIKKRLVHPLFENQEIVVLDKIEEGTKVVAGMFGKIAVGMRVKPKIVETVR